jgi:hypothetical protein
MAHRQTALEHTALKKTKKEQKARTIFFLVCGLLSIHKLLLSLPRDI